MQERKKNQVPTSYLLQDLPLSFFSPMSRSSQERGGIFCQRATYKGSRSTGSQGSRWVRQGWSVATKGEREKEKKRKEKDQGRWSVATRRGREKKKKRKEKAMEGKKVATVKARFHVPYTKNFFFWFMSIWAWKRPVLVEVLAPTRLGLRGSHVRRKFRKRTILRSESSTLKGLLHAPIKREQYHKRTTLRRLKSCCEAFIARKVRTIALERSVSEKAVFRQATINLIHELEILWWFHAWAVLRSLANPRKCQLKDFCEKERYDQSNGRAQQTPSARFRKEKTYL